MTDYFSQPVHTEKELSVIHESPDEMSVRSQPHPSVKNVPYMVAADELFYLMNHSNSSSEPTTGASTNPTIRQVGKAPVGASMLTRAHLIDRF